MVMKRKHVKFVNESGFPIEVNVKELDDGMLLVTMRKCRLSKYITDCAKCQKCEVGKHE